MRGGDFHSSLEQIVEQKLEIMCALDNWKKLEVAGTSFVDDECPELFSSRREILSNINIFDALHDDETEKQVENYNFSA